MIPNIFPFGIVTKCKSQPQFFLFVSQISKWQQCL